MNSFKHLLLLVALVLFSLNQALCQVDACTYAGLTNPVDGLVIDKNNYSSKIQNGDEIQADGNSTAGITSNLIITINGYTPSPTSGNVPNPSTGTWNKTISLDPGVNIISLTAKCGISGCLQAGNLCATHTITFIKPLEANDFYTTTVNSSSIKVKWFPFSSGNLYYRVRRSTTNDASTSTPISSFSSTVSEYIDANITVGVQYYYWIETSNTSTGIKTSSLLASHTGMISGSVSLDDYSETYSELGEIKIVVATSNTSINVSTNENWISVTPNNGNSGTNNISVTVTPNTSGLTRQGNVTFTPNGGSAQTYSITQPTQILPPGGVTVTNVTTNSADISWSSVPSAISYNITDCNGNLITNVTGTSYSMTGLNSNSNLGIQVQTVASGGSTSTFTSCINFTTLSSNVITTILNENVCELDTIEVAVIADGATNVGAISLTNPFDNMLLQYINVTNIHPNLAGPTFLYFEANGVLSVAWTADIFGGNYSTTIPSNDTLFKIKFVALSDGVASIDFDLTTQGACEYADASLVTMNSIFNNGQVTVFDLPTAPLSSSDIDNIICYNDEVIFTTTISANHETIFYINGIAATSQGTNSTFTTTTLNDGDVVTVEVINTLTGCSDFSTPEVFIIDCGNVGGFIKYSNTAETPIDSAMVYLYKSDGTFVDSTMADINGYYAFEDLSNDDYYLIVTTGKPNQAVNATDALFILHHFVQTPNFILQGIELKASDVNLSLSTTSLDALEVMQKFVGLLQTFSAGNYVFEDIIFSITSGNTLHNIYALCTGDVNGSNIPDVGENVNITLIENGNIIADIGEIIRIPVLATNKITPAALTLEFSYPNQVIEVQNIEVKGQGTMKNAVIDNGIIKIAAVNMQGIPLEANDTLLIIEAKVLKDNTSTNPILGISSKSELADITAVKMDNISLSIPQLSKKTTWSQEQLKEAGFDLNVFPNPFDEQTNIQYTLPEGGEVTIMLFDGLGRTISIVTEQINQAGTYNFPLNASKLPVSGIYHLRILFDGVEYKDIPLTTNIYHKK